MKTTKLIIGIISIVLFIIVMFQSCLAGLVEAIEDSGESSGYSLGENCEIKTFKAIVVSYETFDGETRDNPYYDTFCSLYKGQKLN